MSAITDKLGYKIVDPWINLHLPHHGEVFTRLEKIQFIANKFHRLDQMIKGFTEEEHLQEMDRAGVEKGVLSTYGHEYIEYPDARCCTNEEVLSVAAKYPDRFIPAVGFNSLRLLRLGNGIMDCVRKLEEYAKQGLKALKVIPFYTQMPFNDKMFYPLYAKCVELKIPITINLGICGPLYGSAVVQNPLALDDLCLTFPELVVIGAHMGHPWESLLIRLMEKFENLYLMTSAYGPRYIIPEMIKFMNGRGSYKVMFSADFPLAGYERFIEQAVKLPLEAGAMRNYLRDNALRIFNWKW